jgi:hypothetical protein
MIMTIDTAYAGPRSMRAARNRNTPTIVCEPGDLCDVNKQYKRILRKRPSPDCTPPTGVRRASVELLTETECVGAVVARPRRRGVYEAAHKFRDCVCHRQRWRCQRRVSTRSCPTQRDPQLQRDFRYQGARWYRQSGRAPGDGWGGGTSRSASSSLRWGVGRRPTSQQLCRRLLHIEADGERCLAQARYHRQRRRQMV